MKPTAVEAGNAGMKPAAVEAGNAVVKFATMEPAAACEIRPQESYTEN